MFGSTPMPPASTDPNDRLARIEAKLDEVQRYNRYLLYLLIVTLLVAIVSVIVG
jgi:hypothetical protein